LKNILEAGISPASFILTIAVEIGLA